MIIPFYNAIMNNNQSCKTDTDMNLYNNEGIITLFKSGSFGSSAVQRASDKNVINILNSLPHNEVEKIINLKMIANHLHYNSSVKRYNILNNYFNFQSFSDEGKADFIFKCLFINNPKILKKALSLLNDSVLKHFKDSFISNFHYINLKCNLSPHFYLLKELLSEKQFKEIEPYLLYIITDDSQVHFSSLFCQALSTDDHPNFQRKMVTKIYESLSKEKSFNSVMNIDFSNPDFYQFYLKNNILRSNDIFKNIMLYSKHDTSPYMKFLASQNVFDDLLKENRGYFFNHLQDRIRGILNMSWQTQWKPENEKVMLKEEISRFLKPLQYISEHTIKDIVEMYFKLYKDSAIYISDNKDMIDNHYKNVLIDELNKRLQKEQINKDNFAFTEFNFALQQYSTLKEKELITLSLPSNPKDLSSIPQKRL